jgi:sugar lactone lactonase YvrE
MNKRTWIKQNLALTGLMALVVLLILGELAFHVMQEKNLENWTTYKHPDSRESSSQMTSIAFGEHDQVWVGRSARGLSVLAQDGTWANYTPDNSGLVGNYVYRVTIDKQGQVWVGTMSRLNVLAPDGTWTTYNYPIRPDYGVTGITIDKQGQIWVGTSQGLFILAPDGTWTTYTPANSDLPDASIYNIALDEQDRVWLGTSLGLSVLAADGTWTTYTPANSGLPDASISGIAFDKRGQVWVMTSESLSMLAPDGTWMTYTPANSGLPDDTLYTIAIDEQDRVWLGTSDGLRRFNIPDEISGQDTATLISVWPAIRGLGTGILVLSTFVWFMIWSPLLYLTRGQMAETKNSEDDPASVSADRTAGSIIGGAVGGGLVAGFVTSSLIYALDEFFASSLMLSQNLAYFAPHIGLASLVVGGIVGALPVWRDNVGSLVLIALAGMVLCGCPMAAYINILYQTGGPGGTDPLYTSWNLPGIMALIVISMVLGGKLGKTFVAKISG